jgi:nitronate monooxygenase
VHFFYPLANQLTISKCFVSFTGDPGGHMRRALAAFPDQDMAQTMIDKYFLEGGKAKMEPYKTLPMWSLHPQQHLFEATVVANFCEVWLAKHNDDSTPIEDAIVGINLLTKVQLPTLASLYGAMLAGVDYVIMGAGIPLQVPGALDKFTIGEDALFPIDVHGSEFEHTLRFSPTDFWAAAGKPELVKEVTEKMRRPNFLPIVSSVVLAQSLLKKANGMGPTKGVNGFVIELNTAGGHNAPPRGFRYDPVSRSHAVDLNERGEPIYGPKDDVDLVKFKAAVKDVPFWLAGSYAHPDKLSEVIEVGGHGVQVGTMFALCRESGLETNVKAEILEKIAGGQQYDVFTDPVASPTGYPFKVLKIEDSLSSEKNYNERPRCCSLGYLRTPYVKSESGKDGEEKIGYRCPAEPVDEWIKKGGEPEATVGRKCLCNALLANVGMPQIRSIKNEQGEKTNYIEDMLITIGDEVNLSKRLIKKDKSSGKYIIEAADVVNYLKSELEHSEAVQEIRDAVFGKKGASDKYEKTIKVPVGKA